MMKLFPEDGCWLTFNTHSAEKLSTNDFVPSNILPNVYVNHIGENTVTVAIPTNKYVNYLTFRGIIDIDFEAVKQKINAQRFKLDQSGLYKLPKTKDFIIRPFETTPEIISQADFVRSTTMKNVFIYVNGKHVTSANIVGNKALCIELPKKLVMPF